MNSTTDIVKDTFTAPDLEVPPPVSPKQLDQDDFNMDIANDTGPDLDDFLTLPLSIVARRCNFCNQEVNTTDRTEYLEHIRRDYEHALVTLTPDQQKIIFTHNLLNQIRIR